MYYIQCSPRRPPRRSPAAAIRAESTPYELSPPRRSTPVQGGPRWARRGGCWVGRAKLGGSTWEKRGGSMAPSSSLLDLYVAAVAGRSPAAREVVRGGGSGRRRSARRGRARRSGVAERERELAATTRNGQLQLRESETAREIR